MAVIIQSTEQGTVTDKPPEDQKSLSRSSTASDFKWR